MLRPDFQKTVWRDAGWVSGLEKRLTCLPLLLFTDLFFLEGIPGCQLKTEQGQMGSHMQV